MTDRSVTPASALAAAEMTRLQPEGGTATQRMAAARTDDEVSPFESNEGPGEQTQHASTTTAAAAAAASGSCSASMPMPAHASPWLTAQGEAQAREARERLAEQRQRTIKKLELEAQLRELEQQERREQRAPELDGELGDHEHDVWQQLSEARAAREAAERERAERAASWHQHHTPLLPSPLPPNLGGGASPQDMQHALQSVMELLEQQQLKQQRLERQLVQNTLLADLQRRRDDDQMSSESSASSRASKAGSTASAKPKSFADNRPRDLSSGEIAALRTKLKPEEISSWLLRASAHLSNKGYHEIAAVINEDPEDYEKLETEDPLSAHQANRWVASNLALLLDPSSVHVQRFHAECATDPNLMVDGRAWLRKARAISRSEPGPERKMRIESYAKNAFFAAGATFDETVVAAQRLQEARAVLPTNPRPNDLLHALIEKVPKVTESIRKKMAELTDELEITEYTGDAPPWTQRELVARIAQALATAPKQRGHWQAHTTALPT